MNEIDSDDDHLPDPIDPDTITEGQGQTAWIVPGYDAAGNVAFESGDTNVRHGLLTTYMEVVIVPGSYQA